MVGGQRNYYLMLWMTPQIGLVRGRSGGGGGDGHGFYTWRDFMRQGLGLTKLEGICPISKPS